MLPNQERLIASFHPSAYFLLIAADTFIFLKQKVYEEHARRAQWGQTIDRLSRLGKQEDRVSFQTRKSDKLDTFIAYLDFSK